MKTNFKIYLAACSVMAALGSCNQEAVLEGASANQEMEARTITMQAKLGVDSRIAFDENETSLNLLWEENDAFSVMAGKAVQKPATFTLTEGAGTNKGSFSGKIGCNDGDTLYAVWPIMANGMSAEHQCFWDLAGQKGVLDDLYTFMVGQGQYVEDESVAMSFSYMTAAVRMNLVLPEGVEKLTKVDVKVNGAYRKAIVNIDSGGLIFDGGTNGGVTIENDFDVVNCQTSVVAYFFAWQYSALNNGKVVVTDNNGVQYEGTLPNGNIRPGKLYDTTIEFVANEFKEDENGTYTIHNAKDWSTFVSMVNEGNTFEGKTVKLAADIDLKNELQAPIGLKENNDLWNDVTFAGTLDGQNHAIKNLKIDNSTGRFTGLFSYMQKGTIKNLRIVGGEVKSTGNAIYTGAFVGYGRGVTLINCHNVGCKVVLTNENESGYAGGITGCLNRTPDGSIYSFLIACSNSAEVSSVYCPAGITAGAWGGYVSIVGCINTGKISYSGTKTGELNILAAGIATAIGGNAWMYGCFSDCDIVKDGYNHSAVATDIGYTGENLHYSYSANTELPLLCFGWGGSPERETIGYSTYKDAVDKLNKGIDLYNYNMNGQSNFVPCTYKFVAGDEPKMIYAEPSSQPVGGGNNFWNGGKF